MKRAALFLLAAWVLLVTGGTLRNRDFWSTATQRGDAQMRKHNYPLASKNYTDPWHLGVAQYRNGDFETAAKTFARVPGATGAFNQGNAQLMHGQYEAAIASYDRALGFHPGWQEALDNKGIAAARKARMEASNKDADKEQADAYDPDKIVFDQKGKNAPQKPVDLAANPLSDEALRSTWLRRLQTTPADFLRAKFAYQAAKEDAP